MASLPLSEADIRAHTSGGSYERGQQYLEEGAVQALTLEDERTLTAKVQGSAVHPYIVHIHFDEESVTEAECTCPYHGGTWCKHIAATLLEALKTDDLPKSESVAVAEMVETLDREALVQLLKQLVERDPSLMEAIEQERGRLSEEASA